MGEDAKKRIEVEHEESDGRGAFFVAREGVHLADMTYSRAAPDHVIIDHTEVSPELAGQGVGRTLLDAAVAWARATGTRLMATCPFTLGQFARDPSIRDVVA